MKIAKCRMKVRPKCNALGEIEDIDGQERYMKTKARTTILAVTCIAPSLLIGSCVGSCLRHPQTASAQEPTAASAPDEQDFAQSRTRGSLRRPGTSIWRAG